MAFTSPACPSSFLAGDTSHSALFLSSIISSPKTLPSHWPVNVLLTMGAILIYSVLRLFHKTVINNTEMNGSYCISLKCYLQNTPSSNIKSSTSIFRKQRQIEEKRSSAQLTKEIESVSSLGILWERAAINGASLAPASYIKVKSGYSNEGFHHCHPPSHATHKLPPQY